MVLYKQGEKLYNGVQQLVSENLEHLANTVIIPAFPTGTNDPAVQNGEEELLLRALRKVWDDHKSNMFRLGQILKYMVSLCRGLHYYLPKRFGAIGSRPYQSRECASYSRNGSSRILESHHEAPNKRSCCPCYFEANTTRARPHLH